MKYLCLICAETVMEQMSAADAAKHFEEYSRFTAAIRKSGHLVAVNRLKPPHAATTVRVRQGKVSTTDGPFAETKEQLGGYYVIEARGLSEAIRLASRIPGAWIGCVEVRPIAEDAQTLRALGLAARDAPRARGARARRPTGGAAGPAPARLSDSARSQPQAAPPPTGGRT